MLCTYMCMYIMQYPLPHIMHTFIQYNNGNVINKSHLSRTCRIEVQLPSLLQEQISLPPLIRYMSVWDHQ